MGRTGKKLCSEGVQGDLVCLGKSISGGILPVSAVLGSDEIFSCIKPGDHGSTWGGNPLACALAMKSCSLLTNGLLDSVNRLG